MSLKSKTVIVDALILMTFLQITEGIIAMKKMFLLEPVIFSTTINKHQANCNYIIPFCVF